MSATVVVQVELAAHGSPTRPGTSGSRTVGVKDNGGAHVHGAVDGYGHVDGLSVAKY